MVYNDIMYIVYKVHGTLCTLYIVSTSWSVLSSLLDNPLFKYHIKLDLSNLDYKNNELHNLSSSPKYQDVKNYINVKIIIA